MFNNRNNSKTLICILISSPLFPTQGISRQPKLCAIIAGFWKCISASFRIPRKTYTPSWLYCPNDNNEFHCGSQPTIELSSFIHLCPTYYLSLSRVIVLQDDAVFRSRFCRARQTIMQRNIGVRRDLLWIGVRLMTQLSRDDATKPVPSHG